ncbi:hypothetical protein [Breoghania sp. JC706]|uniref:hypothetical protein n=1 Tax=Breoghania sp. JC706 TaxID=3117732 RepID=UPI0030085516
MPKPLKARSSAASLFDAAERYEAMADEVFSAASNGDPLADWLRRKGATYRTGAEALRKRAQSLSWPAKAELKRQISGA